MGETTVTNEIVKFLNDMPWSFAHETPNSGRIRNGRVVGKTKTPGMSDINWNYFGINIKLETKLKNGKQSNDQVDFQEDIEYTGGLYFLVRSVQDVIEIIDDLNSSHWFKKYVDLRYYKGV